MSQNGFRPSEETLHAFVDGFLAEPERSAVERYLADNPGEAARVEAYRQQNAALQALRSLPEARRFTPPEFGRRIAWRAVALRVAAAAVLLAAGLAGGWSLHDRLQPSTPLWLRLVQQAERAHQTYVPEVVHPVEVTSDQEQHLRTWLSKRLGTPIRVPVLRRDGYDLVGGRLLPGNPGPAAQFMYQDGQGNRLTLYLLAAPATRRDSSFRYVQSGNLWICTWVGESIDFVLTAEVDRDRMQGIAKDVYMQLNDMKPPKVGSW
jgi:anti-sigma factor RsiW